jgi:hypothetical protein
MLFFSNLKRCRLLTPAMLLGLIWLNGCANTKLKPGTEVVRFDDPSKVEVVNAPADGRYGCYQEGKAEPLEVATLGRGEPLGFEVVSPDEGRGLMTPKLIGIAGKQRFMLPLGDRYAWKRM